MKKEDNGREGTEIIMDLLLNSDEKIDKLFTYLRIGMHTSNYPPRPNLNE